MAKLDSSLKNMLLSLSLISFVASAVLAVSFSLTKEPILKAQLKKQQDAIQEVLPIKDAEIGKEVEIKLDGKPDAFIIYPAQKGDELVGAAVKTYSYDGYAGKIEVMVGLDKEGTISNYTVLAASETPGLGSKIKTLEERIQPKIILLLRKTEEILMQLLPQQFLQEHSYLQ